LLLRGDVDTARNSGRGGDQITMGDRGLKITAMLGGGGGVRATVFGKRCLRGGVAK